ncbi:MAG: guanylate kinase [Gemmatimonadota bacterium]
MSSAAPCPALALVAPSGTGKTTVAHALVQRSERFRFSVSATTRRPRGREVDGVDYHFLDEATFRAWIEQGRFAEWAAVHGRLYGTPLANFEVARQEGVTLLLDIDVQGALEIQERVPDALVIFLLPPTGRALLERLRGRGTETRQELAARLRTALAELDLAPRFPIQLVNQNVDETARVLEALVDRPALRSGAFDEGARVAEIAATLREELERLEEGSREAGSLDYT